MKKLNVALVGLGFGGAFAKIYKVHPNVESLTLFDTDDGRMKAVYDNISETDGAALNCASSFGEIIENPQIDAVHLVTPIPYHADQSVAVLKAGKHCACTVPMATSVEDIERICEAKRASGRNYMMMETTLYTYQYHYVSAMKASGELGRIQFMRGSHYQDMERWPWYWLGLPPMWYGTHAIAPMVGLSDSRISRVSCIGSGTMNPEYSKQYGNPYPVESAHFVFANGMKGEATRSLFETARVYQEGLFVYGSKSSFEWGFADGDAPYVTTLVQSDLARRGGSTPVKQIELPNYYENLPQELHPFTVGGNFDPLNPQESLKKGAGGGHHGSHPHLVHEFVMSCVEERPPAIDEHMSANITAAGVIAHTSAMNDGEWIDVPEF